MCEIRHGIRWMLRFLGAFSMLRRQGHEPLLERVADFLMRGVGRHTKNFKGILPYSPGWFHGV